VLILAKLIDLASARLQIHVVEPTHDWKDAARLVDKCISWLEELCE
jgi:hypothetical protein